MNGMLMNEKQAIDAAAQIAKDETMGWTYTPVQVSAKWWKIEVRDEEGFVVS